MSLYTPPEASDDSQGDTAPRAASEQDSAAPSERAGFGLEYDHKEVHAKSETTVFNTAGTVTTADGRKLSFQQVDLIT